MIHRLNFIYFTIQRLRTDKANSLNENIFGKIVEEACSFANFYKKGFTDGLTVDSSYDLVRQLLTRKQIKVAIKSIESNLFSLLSI